MMAGLLIFGQKIQLFQLENLKHVPRMVEKDMNMITCDEHTL